MANGPEPKTSFGDAGRTLLFRDVELNVSAYELRRRGRRVRLERQPMDLLILLVERRGQLVARHDIVERLWGRDVFVDVETGIHRAILKIRQALHDSADAPAFIETVSGKGYRFIAPLEEASPAAVEDLAAVATPAREPLEPAGQAHLGSAPHPRDRRRRVVLLATAVVGLVALMSAAAWLDYGGLSRTPDVTLAVLPFENLSGDLRHPARDRR